MVVVVVLKQEESNSNQVTRTVSFSWCLCYEVACEDDRCNKVSWTQWAAASITRNQLHLRLHSSLRRFDHSLSKTMTCFVTRRWARVAVYLQLRASFTLPAYAPYMQGWDIMMTGGPLKTPLKLNDQASVHWDYYTWLGLDDSPSSFSFQCLHHSTISLLFCSMTLFLPPLPSSVGINRQ